jgi:hypothetical protein
MNIEPSPEFQQAFREVFGVECTPGNLILAIRSNDPRLDAVEAGAAPAGWLQQAARRDRIAALIREHLALGGRDGPGPEIMGLVWQQFREASKVEIDNVWCDCH